MMEDQGANGVGAVRLPFKISYGGCRKAAIADSFDDLLKKACEKFDVSNGKIHLEEDHTEIDEDYFTFLSLHQVLELEVENVDSPNPSQKDTLPLARRASVITEPSDFDVEEVQKVIFLVISSTFSGVSTASTPTSVS
ncbi:uncharacterized protein LOC135486560 [Lineus longissimus]|uniref:uncharacterized protein LOC135486560 n=1 Tax=Lineus longissimus TaxID=88925 RepID=UPI00315D8740